MNSELRFYATLILSLSFENEIRREMSGSLNNMSNRSPFYSSIGWSFEKRAGHTAEIQPRFTGQPIIQTHDLCLRRAVTEEDHLPSSTFGDT